MAERICCCEWGRLKIRPPLQTVEVDAEDQIDWSLPYESLSAEFGEPSPCFWALNLDHRVGLQIARCRRMRPSLKDHSENISGNTSVRERPAASSLKQEPHGLIGVTHPVYNCLSRLRDSTIVTHVGSI